MHKQTPPYTTIIIGPALLCNLLLLPTCQAFSLEDMTLEKACEVLQLDPAIICSKGIEDRDKVKAMDKAYRKCVRENHPDTKKGKAEVEAAHQVMMAINRAKEVIKKYIEDDSRVFVMPPFSQNEEDVGTRIKNLRIEIFELMAQAESSISEGRYEAAKELLRRISCSEDIKKRIEQAEKDAEKGYKKVRNRTISVNLSRIKICFERAKSGLEWIALHERAVETVKDFEKATAELMKGKVNAYSTPRKLAGVEREHVTWVGLMQEKIALKRVLWKEEKNIREVLKVLKRKTYVLQMQGTQVPEKIVQDLEKHFASARKERYKAEKDYWLLRKTQYAKLDNIDMRERYPSFFLALLGALGYRKLVGDSTGSNSKLPVLRQPKVAPKIKPAPIENQSRPASHGKSATKPRKLMKLGLVGSLLAAGSLAYVIKDKKPKESSEDGVERSKGVTGKKVIFFVGFLLLLIIVALYTIYRRKR